MTETCYAFHFDHLPPGLNGKDGLLRMHWSKRSELLELWTGMVLEQKRAADPFPIEKCRVEFWLRVRQLMDWDNASARFKLVGDALVRAHVLKDDSPKVVDSFQVYQERVLTSEGLSQGCSILIYVKAK